MSYITSVYLIFTLDSKPLSRAYLPQPVSYLHESYLLVWSCEYNSKCTHGFVPGYYHGQTMKSSTPRKQKMKVSSTTIRTRTSPSQLACRLSRLDMGLPRLCFVDFRCDMLNLPCVAFN